MKKYYLYALFDPNLKIPKYIGISNNPERRYKEHLEDISNTKKTKWIKTLKDGGLVPTLKTIRETDNVYEITKLEKYYIEKLQEKYGLVNSTKGGEYYAIGTPIDVYDLEGNYIDSYNSMIEYAELNNLSINSVSGISAVCLRKRNYAYNHIFRYVDDVVTEEDLIKLKKSYHSRDPKHFIIVTPNKEILGEFNSLQEAEREGFGKQNTISEVLREVPGFNSVNGNLVCYSMEDFDRKLSKYLSGKSKNKLIDCISKYDFDGNYIDTYYSLSDAYNSIKRDENIIGHKDLIKKCCENKYKQAFGYQWKYGNNKNNIGKCEAKKRRTPNSPINQYDKDNNLIKTWSCCREAADALNISREAINRAASGQSKSSGGYIWKYVNDAV